MRVSIDTRQAGPELHNAEVLYDGLFGRILDSTG